VVRRSVGVNTRKISCCSQTGKPYETCQHRSTFGTHIKTYGALPLGPFTHFQPAMELDYSVFLHQSPLPSFGRLTHMLYLGYLGQTFGAAAAKRHVCHNILRYFEDEDNIVINQELLRPEYSYLGLPGTFSVSHDLYPYLRCNSIAADNSRRIIIDCEVPEGTKTVVPQNLFSPYAGIARSQAELRSASLLPPIFFFRPDHSVGLPLKTAQSAESHSQLLLYDNWCPLEGRTSIKMRIAVKCLLINHS
jgi:hypothetical protein